MADHTRLHTRAMALFDAERRALLHADFGALPALLEEKEKLLAALEGARPALGADLADLTHAAQRNQGLFAAAIKGLREGRAQAAPPSFSTYSQGGTRAAFQAARPAFERKA